MQESCKVSRERVKGVEARDTRISKRHREDLATGHMAEAEGKTVNKLPTVEISKEFINKRMPPL